MSETCASSSSSSASSDTHTVSSSSSSSSNTCQLKDQPQPFNGARCCVCDTCFYHYGYDPMKIGCQCVDRICKWCVRVGQIVNCPICRRYKKKPLVDVQLKKTQIKSDSNQGVLITCLGCSLSFPVRDIEQHEQGCFHYREYLDKVYLDSFEFYRDKTNACEREIAIMQERMNLQEQEIEEWEDTCDGYKIMAAVYEAEKRVYAFEQQQMLTSLNRLSRPLANLGKKVQRMQNTVEDLKTQIRESKESHRMFSQKRRRLGLDTSSVEIVEEILQVDDASTSTEATEVQPSTERTSTSILEPHPSDTDSEDDIQEETELTTTVTVASDLVNNSLSAI